MGKIEPVLIWFGGYSPEPLSDEDRQDREAIAKIGAAVLFSTVFAVLSWAIAGWTYTAASDTKMRFAVALIAASLGGFSVVLLDRSAIYFFDTSMEASRLKIAFYGAARISMIIAIGSFTSQAIMPLLLGNELKSHALQMCEKAEKTRFSDLKTRYSVTQMESDIKTIASEVNRLRTASVSLPAKIQKKFEAVNRCWSDFENQKATLLLQNYSIHDVNENQTAVASYCKEISKEANRERAAYFSRVTSKLKQAIANKRLQESEYSKVTAAIESRLENARSVEAESFNPRSATVLWNTLKDNPGVLSKWALLSSLLLLFELLPFILKLQAGQSNIGRHVAINRAIRRLDLSTVLQQREHDYSIFSAVTDKSMEAVSEALLKPEVKTVFAQAFAANIAAFAPVEAVRAMMRDLEARNVDVDRFMSRYPKLARVISEAWAKAVKDTSSTLSRGINIESAN